MHKIDDSVVYFSFICLLTEKVFKDKEPEMFAILGAHNAFPVDCTNTRITIPSLESGMFKWRTSTDGRVETFRYVKCLARIMLPKRAKLFSCVRCCHSLVKSYDFKNIVLFIMKNHPDDSYWIPERLCCRLVEVFDILQCCIPTDDPDSVARVSTCSTPGATRIDSIATYRPNTYATKEKSGLLFTPVSHIQALNQNTGVASKRMLKKLMN